MKHNSRPVLPIALAILLFLGSGICCWLIWKQHSMEVASGEADKETVDRLANQRKELADLLLLSPCDAQKKLGQTIADKPSRTTEPHAAVSGSGPEPAREETSASVGATSTMLDNIERSCVFLASAHDARHLSTGSGFFVSPDCIITNRHVVDNSPGRVLVTGKALGKPVMGKVVAKSSGANTDYALVKISVPPGAAPVVLPFARDIKKTEKIGAWGFPNLVGKNDPAYDRLLRQGDISAVPELSYTEGVISAILPRNPDIIVHTAPISPGNSGGPLVNSQGQVVGINTMITLDEDSYRQASLALSAHDLQKFLARQGIEVKK